MNTAFFFGLCALAAAIIYTTGIQDVFAFIGTVFIAIGFFACILVYAAFSSPAEATIATEDVATTPYQQPPPQYESLEDPLKWQRERNQRWKEEEKELFKEETYDNKPFVCEFKALPGQRVRSDAFYAAEPRSQYALNFHLARLPNTPVTRPGSPDSGYESEGSKCGTGLITYTPPHTPPPSTSGQTSADRDFSATFGQWRNQEAQHGLIPTASGIRPATEYEARSNDLGMPPHDYCQGRHPGIKRVWKEYEAMKEQYAPFASHYGLHVSMKCECCGFPFPQGPSPPPPPPPPPPIIRAPTAQTAPYPYATSTAEPTVVITVQQPQLTTIPTCGPDGLLAEQKAIKQIGP